MKFRPMIVSIVSASVLLGLAFSEAAAEAWQAPLRQALGGKRVIFFGDSITDQNNYLTAIAKGLNQDQPKPVCEILNARGLHEAVEKIPSGKTVLINAGLNGGKVTDLRDGATNLYGDAQASFATLLEKIQPQVVVIYIGINDVWHGAKGTTADAFSKELAALVAVAQQHDAAILLVTPSVIGEKNNGKNTYDRRLDQYAEITHATAEAAKTGFCNLRKAMIEEIARRNPDDKKHGILTYDGVHLNKNGNQFVADQLAGALLKTLPQK